jgi:hypothetical protein
MSPRLDFPAFSTSRLRAFSPYRAFLTSEIIAPDALVLRRFAT